MVMLSKIGVFRSALSVFSVEQPPPATANYSTFRLATEFDSGPSVLQQLHSTALNACTDGKSSAAVTCEKFRCYVPMDPSAENQSKFQAAVVKITFEDDSFSICHGYLVAPMWVLTTVSCILNRWVSIMS